MRQTTPHQPAAAGRGNDFGGHGQRRQRAVLVALRLVDLRQQVIGGDELLVLGEHFLDRLARIIQLAGHDIAARQAELGPHQVVAHGQGLRIHLARFVDAALVDQQRALGLHDFDDPLGRGLEHVVAFGDGAGEILALHLFGHRQHGVLLFQQAIDAFGDAAGGERLEHVGVGLELGGAGYQVVAAFGGHHDEHGGRRKHVLGTEELQQLLAVAFLVQVVVADDEVVSAGLDETDRLVRRGGLIHFGHAELAEVHPDVLAHRRHVVDDQAAQGADMAKGH